MELVSVRERTRSEHEERLEAEVSRLREQSARELAEIRASGKDVYERENKALREARTDALQVRDFCEAGEEELSALVSPLLRTVSPPSVRDGNTKKVTTSI